MHARQFSGSLVGQCLGDAIGFLVEGQPPEICEHFVRSLSPTEPPKDGRGPFHFGQYSDDSQLARELLQSFIDCGRFDPSDYARRIATIFGEDRIIGRGRATEDAARRLCAGCPWEQAGAPPPQAGNGSAMRAGPIGLLFHLDDAALSQAAHDQGRITHRDPRASAGAVAIAGAVKLALQPGPIDVLRFVSRLAEWAAQFDGTMALEISRLAEWVLLPPDAAASDIGRAGNADMADGWRGISPFVIPSVLWSLYSFLRTPEDYWASICTAIAVGGDVDTTAAMTGAISGAHVGLDRVSPIAQFVQDQGTWGFADLVTLANKCFVFVAGRH